MLLAVSISWAGAGAWAIGVVVGYISMMFIVRAVESDSSAKNLAAFIGVLLGGTVVAFLTNKIGANHNQFGEYGVGLGIGLLVYVIFFWIKTGGPPLLHRRERMRTA